MSFLLALGAGAALLLAGEGTAANETGAALFEACRACHALQATDDRTDVNACWAPMTSELSRVTRAPVWARVKKATGWRWTWAKTWVRRS